MGSETGRSALCYLDAAHVESPAGCLCDAELQNHDAQVIGRLDGVVIDPAQRRLYYYVVSRPGWLRKHRYLLPADRPAQMAPEARTLRFDLTPEDLLGFAEFDGTLRHFSEDDSAVSAPQSTAA